MIINWNVPEDLISFVKGIPETDFPEVLNSIFRDKLEKVKEIRPSLILYTQVQNTTSNVNIEVKEPEKKGLPEIRNDDKTSQDNRHIQVVKEVSISTDVTDDIDDLLDMMK